MDFAGVNQLASPCRIAAHLLLPARSVKQLVAIMKQPDVPALFRNEFDKRGKVIRSLKVPR